MSLVFSRMKQTANIAKRFAKAGVTQTSLDQIEKYTGGPELKHISLEYLLSRSSLPLGSILHIFGPEGCGKSTLALDLLNRCFLLEGGEGSYIDTENKVSVPLVRAIIDPDAESNGMFTPYRAPSEEAVQEVITTLIKSVNQDTFAGKSRDLRLSGIVIDSFRVASKQTQEKIVTDGHATKQFALEANLWRPFISTTAGMLLYSPVSIIIVNHMTETEGAYGKVKDHGGGKALKYHMTYSILVTKTGTHKTKTENYSDLGLQTYKNSNGPDKLKICPRLYYKSPDLEEGRILVDWSIADARLMSGPDIPREALKKAGVCNVKESSKAGLYSDDVLGLTCVPIQEIMEKIYADPDKLAALRKELNICRIKTLEELNDSGWFFEARSLTAADESDEEDE